MQITSRITLAFAVSAGTCTGIATAAAPTFQEKEQAAIQFRQDNPQARIMDRFERPHKIAAKRIATGATALESANAARQSVATMLGVDVNEFIAEGPFPDGSHSINLGWQPETETYKFTSVYWTQTADGLPVWRTRLNVLVRNAAEFPAVYVTSDVREVGNFTAPADRRPNLSLARAAANREVGIAATMTNPEVVCFAGIDDMRFTPRAAMVFEAEIGSKLNDSFEKYLLIVDLETGAVLHLEDRIVHDVSGTVSGLATQGSGADECEDELPMAMPYLLVSGGGNSAYTDASGNFSLPGSGSVTVSAGVSGEWFAVNNAAGGETSESTTIPNGGFGAITLNESNNNEAVRAQVNGYVESNVVRDFTLGLVPDFPVIGNQNGFPVNVMVSGSCNAFYDYSSINFYPLSGGCNNTAFSVVVHHEYGHHLVSSGGSAQDAYGEGMGDVLGVLITGDPKLARGFYQGDCVDGIRNADNDFQYPCSGEIHYCGQLISGCAWDMLLLMEETYPNGNDIVSRLFIESITLHSGGSIDPTITLDILTLDDDDGDLDNGTPHSVEILAAMELHSMDEIPEPLGNDFCSDAYAVTDGSTAFSTVGAFTDGDPYNDAQCTGTYLGEMASDVWFSYEACESGPMTVSTCDSVTFDTDIVVYEGNCENKTQVSCNGDGAGCGGYTSTLTFDAVQGGQYLIRVGGWDSSSIGSGNLLIDGPGVGPPCNTLVTIELPNGAPDIVDPAGGTMVDVTITPGSAEPDPGSAMLYFNNNGMGWAPRPMEHLGGNDYLAMFPSMECGAVDWYISVMAKGQEMTLPGNAPDSSYSAAVLTDVEIAFDDNFETDQGWMVTNGATEGNWDRGVPAGDGGARCDNPTDADGSGSCYVTGNAFNEDVDGGTTILTSPEIPCSDGSTVSYWRWYNNGSPCNGSDPLNDIMEIEISYDGGSSWENLETVGPSNEASGGWYNPSFVLGEVPNGTIMLRFVVGDLGTGSVIEAAVDGVLIQKPTCEDDPDCPGDFDGSGVIDVNDVLHLISSWGGDGGDVDGNGTTDVNDLLLLLSLYGDIC
ncbi:MAG: hypothetical protein VX527_03685 [Planctomycetota bacterium]|nr:hypothetical protein [Planctomycetota bacterium]